MPDADYEHQEKQDQMSDRDINIKHAVLEGGKRASFHYIKSEAREGWIVDCKETYGLAFVWELSHGEYGAYTLRVLENADGPQYICCGIGPVPIGYAVKDTTEQSCVRI